MLMTENLILIISDVQISNKQQRWLYSSIGKNVQLVLRSFYDWLNIWALFRQYIYKLMFLVFNI